ncbi:hypothetical protein MRX96_058397 [Rhipicephalus microplus]
MQANHLESQFFAVLAGFFPSAVLEVFPCHLSSGPAGGVFSPLEFFTEPSTTGGSLAKEASIREYEAKQMEILKSKREAEKQKKTREEMITLAKDVGVPVPPNF